MKRAEIEHVALRVLFDAGINSLPIDPFLIARNAEIVVRAMPREHLGVSGMLIRVGERFGIYMRRPCRATDFGASP